MQGMEVSMVGGEFGQLQFVLERPQPIRFPSVTGTQASACCSVETTSFLLRATH